MNINEDILDASITHSIYLERYKNYEAKKITSYLNQAEKEILAEIDKYKNVTKWTEDRRNKLLDGVKEIQRKYNGLIKSEVNADMKSLAKVESDFIVKTLNAKIPEIFQIEVNKISEQELWSMIKPKPMMFTNGNTFTVPEALAEFGVKNVNAVEQVINQGLIQGKTAAQISKQLRDSGLWKGRKNTCDTLVRTISGNVSNQAKIFTYKDNPKLIKGYQWISVLDERTTHECANNDGKVWIFDDVEREQSGEDLLEGEIYPPIHYGCRSQHVALTRDWKELGFEKMDIPEGTRAAMGGQVPRSTTYYEWLQRQSAGIQKEVIGVTRYNAWKAGEITPDKFYKDGKWLTLSELSLK